MSSLISSLVGGLFGIGQQAMQNRYNSNEAAKNRQFQSDEAALNRIFQSNEAALQRDWSAAEAERARDWNEEMYAKYNSLSGKIAQAEQAGVNPMFAVTGNSVSPMSTTASAPSGAAAGSVGTPSGSTAASSFVDIIGAMLGFKKVQAETNLLEAEADKFRSESNRLSKLTEAELEHLLMDTSRIESDIHVNNETAGKLSAEALKLQKEGERLAKITDSEVKKAEADALISEFQSSVYRITSDFENASTEDYIQMGVYLLEKIIGIGVQLSPRGIVHMN